MREDKKHSGLMLSASHSSLLSPHFSLFCLDGEAPVHPDLAPAQLLASFLRGDPPRIGR